MMITTKIFSDIVKIWKTKPRYISLCGGTRSGKTYAILQFLLVYVARKKCLVSVVSETYPHLRRGVIRDMEAICTNEGLDWKRIYNASTSTIKIGTGQIEFFSADAPSKVHGPTRDILFLNECQNIPRVTAIQLFVRTKERILMDYNPTHEFWVEEFERQEECKRLHSTYVDNPFLAKGQIREIERNKENTNWWRVYGLGLYGELEGQVFPFEICDDLDKEQLENKAVFVGMDFGFTHDPTAAILMVADTDKRELWVDELLYGTGIDNTRIANGLKIAFEKRKINPATPVYADCAEPKSIADIRKAGINIKPCLKGGTGGKKIEQVHFVRSWKMCITKKSVNAIKELRQYLFQKDATDTLTNMPMDTFDHVADAIRYGVFTHMARNIQAGQYNITIR